MRSDKPSFGSTGLTGSRRELAPQACRVQVRREQAVPSFMIRPERAPAHSAESPLRFQTRGADTEPVATNWRGDARAVLKMDADEAMRRSARAYLLFIGRHRAVTYSLVVAGTAGTFLGLWIGIGSTATIVLVGLCLVYGVALGVLATVRVRRGRRSP
jgi:hypothetical protein